MTYKVIGLMSGSSLDGLDIAYAHYTVEGEKISYSLKIAETIPFSETWQTRLRHLPTVNALTFAKTNVYFGHYLGATVNDFIQKHQIEVDFIASHGHTIFHYPDLRLTVQIGDGAAMAAVTKLPVVNDFRTHDIALDGEGTPLAPIADKYLFSGYNFYLNIGGIANISSSSNGRFVAFDVGAANQILNPLANLLDLPFDDEGKIARNGQINETLLNAVNSLPFFKKKYPKSLDNTWVQTQILPLYLETEDNIENKLHTACVQLAQQTALSIQQIIKNEKITPRPFQIFVTGGGALNLFLIECLKKACNAIVEVEIIVPERAIIEYKEALLMGLMGVLRMENRVNVMRSVTGATFDTIGGAIWQGVKK